MPQTAAKPKWTASQFPFEIRQKQSIWVSDFAQKIVVLMAFWVISLCGKILSLPCRENWVGSARLNRDEQIEVAGKFVESLDIRAASPDIPVKLLSGGNQQKVILARWLATDPKFLILDEPTRGIDVGAHAEIVRVINRLREDGLALVVISSELDEIVAYSSRIMVMRDREMVAELHGPNISPNVIVQAIANQKERVA